MIRLLCFALMIAVMAGTSAARADSEPLHGDADACQPDIHRLCDKFFPDEKLVAVCLVDRRAELSVACAEVLARPDDATRANPEASKSEPPKSEPTKSEPAKP